VGVLFELEILPVKQEKITITLRSKTEPPITLKLNTWRYDGPDINGKEITPESAWQNAQYFYNQHVCPTSYLREVVEISCLEEADPHGVFEFVSMEFGHYGEESK
jgi:hypothetical protein